MPSRTNSPTGPSSVTSNSNNNNESKTREKITNSNPMTLITSPLRRISSFIEDEEEEEEEELAGELEERKRSENDQLPNDQNQSSFILFNLMKIILRYYFYLIEKRTGFDQEDVSGLPLRKKPLQFRTATNTQMMTTTTTTGTTTAMLSSKLKASRLAISAHRRAHNFTAWWLEIFKLCSWWVEVAGDECAGTVLELITEFKREHHRLNTESEYSIRIHCKNIYIDKFLAKSLVTISIFGIDFKFNFICRHFWASFLRL